MLMNYYGYEIHIPWLEDEEDFEMTTFNVTNLCNGEYILEFQWKDIIFKKWETKALPALAAITTAQHMCTQYLTDNWKLSTDVTAPDIIKEILWLEIVDYWKLNYDELLEVCKEKWIDTFKQVKRKKVDLTKREIVEILTNA